MVPPYLFSSVSFTESLTEEAISLLESIFLLLKVAVVASLPSHNIFNFFSVNCLRFGLFSTIGQIVTTNQWLSTAYIRFDELFTMAFSCNAYFSI